VISLSLWETTIWNAHNPANLYSFHKVLLSYSLHKLSAIQKIVPAERAYKEKVRAKRKLIVVV
jgi:hypothetical protein